MDASFYMQQALDAAWKYQGLTFPNPAVGACVVDANGGIIGVGAHQKAGGPHAEVLALKAAYFTLTQDSRIKSIQDATALHDFLKSHHNNIFKSAQIYVTLEPCAHTGKTPSCATLIQSLGLVKVVISCKDENPIAEGGAMRLRACGIAVEMGLLEKQGQELLYPFTLWQNGSFVIFKWAQRLDGSIDGKTVSSLGSRTQVHQIRNVSDLLVIGGATVREDRPTLDARLVNGKAPDVLIYSREKNFDTSIPLFNVPNRKVIISDDLELLKGYQNVLIEGGPNMMEAVAPYVNYYLSYLSPSSGGTIAFTNTQMQFNVVNMQKNSEDIILWMTRKGL